jgi:hypothetical protein
MVPTLSVLLKIAKGLGRRPEELIRDRMEDESAENGAIEASPTPNENSLTAPDSPINKSCSAGPNVGV